MNALNLLSGAEVEAGFAAAAIEAILEKQYVQTFNSA
jgi:hypothetical protein